MLLLAAAAIFLFTVTVTAGMAIADEMDRGRVNRDGDFPWLFLVTGLLLSILFFLLHFMPVSQAW